MSKDLDFDTKLIQTAVMPLLKIASTVPFGHYNVQITDCHDGLAVTLKFPQGQLRTYQLRALTKYEALYLPVPYPQGGASDIGGSLDHDEVYVSLTQFDKDGNILEAGTVSYGS